MAFMSNNIKYRSVTAKTLECYYNTKAFILNELSDTRNDFSKGAREILLMMLNNYKEWTDFTEQYLLDKKIVGQQEVDVVLSNLQKITSVNTTVFESHPEIFPPELLKLWRKVDINNAQYFHQRIQRAVGMDHLEAYPYLINCLLNSLQTVMCELYEIDCLLGCELLITGRPLTTNLSNPNRLVLIIDDKDIDAITELQVFDPYNRLRHYIQYVDSKSPILIKNLSSIEVGFNSGTGELIGDAVLCQYLLPIIEEFNIVEIIGTKR